MLHVLLLLSVGVGRNHRGLLDGVRPQILRGFAVSISATAHVSDALGLVGEEVPVEVRNLGGGFEVGFGDGNDFAVVVDRIRSAQ